MCSQFILRADAKKLNKKLGLSLKADECHWPEKVFPRDEAPVLVLEKAHRVLKLMQFSLIPPWAKQKRLKYPTHNARLYSFNKAQNKDIPIFEKPSWKNAFFSQRCLVPMTHFIEPIYTGELAGHMVQFFDAQGEILMAAGLWETWASKETGEVVDSFAIITDEPPEFVRKTGHHRSPVFLNESAFETWLSPKNKDPNELLSLLRSKKASFEWGVEKDRPLNPGWEKRRKAR